MTGRLPMPVTVSFSLSTLVVPRDGMPVHLSIFIMSTSETALVTVSGLPSGVSVKYAASDTNPSGSLEFTASADTAVGRYMPKVTVNSANQTVSGSFVLEITSDSETG